jgi:enamine deaminase RidA (YjgF/YER057c/UK114 family)
VRQHVYSATPLEPALGYSRAIRVGDLVCVSATAAIWPDGHVDPSVSVQAERSLEIVAAALGEAGAALEDVIRTRVYLVDRDDAAAVGKVHGRVFADVRPATGFIVVSGFIDPRWKVEIEADAVIGA